MTGRVRRAIARPLDGGLPTAFAALCVAAACASPDGAQAAPLRPLAAGSSCEALRSYQDNDVTVLNVRPVSPDSGLCRVEGVVTPVPGSRVGFTLFLPVKDGWNGRLKMFGNGGYSSDMPIEALEMLAGQGYATVATDTGHRGDDPDFAVGYPEALTDWAYRAVHVSLVAASGMAEAFYEEVPRYRYFEGCSTGGHQALSEVQRYPDDFDGVIAGAPGHNRIRLNAAFLSQFLVNRDPGTPGTPTLPKEALPLLAKASKEACDTDSSTPYIDDPLSCDFDPGGLLCQEADRGEDCLTSRQIEVARKMYAGTRDPQTGDLIYPPWLPGSEAGGPVPDQFPGWSLYWADPQRGDVPARQSFWRFWVFDDPSWTWQDARLGRDVEAALEKLGDTVDATDPDLVAFAASGGKLLHYHGLADPVVSPIDSINYHAAVTARLGETTSDAYRLFLLPGVEHCGGGDGPFQFERQALIEAWVERGEAPDTLTVTYEEPEAGTPLTIQPYETHNGD